MCLPRSLPTSSPRRRGQRGARAAQRARTTLTLTLTSGDARSAARKALAGQHAQRRAIGAQPNCLDPLKNRRQTGTDHSPSAPAQNLCLRRKNPSSNPFGDPHSCRKTHICILCRALTPGSSTSPFRRPNYTPGSCGAPGGGVPPRKPPAATHDQQAARPSSTRSHWATTLASQRSASMPSTMTPNHWST